MYQLLLLKLNFKIYLRSEWRAPPRCGRALRASRTAGKARRACGSRAGGGRAAARGSARAGGWRRRSGRAAAPAARVGGAGGRARAV